MKYYKVFGSKCYIYRDEYNLGEFDNKDDEGTFLRYSARSKAYQCYNKRLNKIIESGNVKVDEDTSKESDKLAGYESDESANKKREEKIIEGEEEK